jgi:hypothetical protein
MKMPLAYVRTTPHMDDDQVVPEELVGRLYGATQGAIMDMLDQFSPSDRANLAMYCYRKSHLHEIGLQIAATCDQATLEKTWGTALGKVLYLQSRERPVGPPKVTSARSKITLARSAGVDFVAADLSDDEIDDEAPQEPNDENPTPGVYVVNLA